MARKAFTPDQVAALNANPSVRLATDRSIQFAEQFKIDAIDDYLNGKPRVQIFADAGFDVAALGRARIRDALGNWLTKRKKAKPVTSEKRGRASTKGLSDEEIIARQKARITMLRQENDSLRQIRRPGRRHQPKNPRLRKARDRVQDVPEMRRHAPARRIVDAQAGGRLEVRPLFLRREEGKPGRVGQGIPGLRRFPAGQGGFRLQRKAQGAEDDIDDDAEALRRRDEQEKGEEAHGGTWARTPGEEGRPAQEDREGDPIQRDVLEQARPPVRRREARRASPHRHQLHPLRAASREAVLPPRPEGRVHQRDRRVDPIGVARRRVRDRRAPEARLRQMAPADGPHPFRPGTSLHLVRLRQVPIGRRHRPVDVAEGQLLGQRADGVLLRARQGRALAPPMLGFRGCPRGDVLAHRLLQ
jgi:transposase